jgi:rod shape-determining protein MreD
VTCLSFFGSVPALTFALVCGVGFIFGEKAGAVCGVLSGILIDLMGSTGFSFSPIVFMLCGYCCGAFVGWFLSKNLPSFLIYAALAGVFKEIFTFVYFGLFSTDISLWKIFINVVIPEYFAYLICVLPAYGAVLGIYCLFKGKDKKRKRDIRH